MPQRMHPLDGIGETIGCSLHEALAAGCLGQGRNTLAGVGRTLRRLNCARFLQSLFVLSCWQR